jgi:hypothetical protein
VRIFEPEQLPVDFPSASTWTTGDRAMIEELNDKMKDIGQA